MKPRSHQATRGLPDDIEDASIPRSQRPPIRVRFAGNEGGMALGREPLRVGAIPDEWSTPRGLGVTQRTTDIAEILRAVIELQGLGASIRDIASVADLLEDLSTGSRTKGLSYRPHGSRSADAFVPGGWGLVGYDGSLSSNPAGSNQSNPEQTSEQGHDVMSHGVGTIQSPGPSTPLRDTLQSPSRTDGGADAGVDGGDGGTDGGSDGGADGGPDGGADGGADGGPDAGRGPGLEIIAERVVDGGIEVEFSNGDYVFLGDDGTVVTDTATGGRTTTPPPPVRNPNPDAAPTELALAALFRLLGYRHPSTSWGQSSSSPNRVRPGRDATPAVPIRPRLRVNILWEEQARTRTAATIRLPELGAGPRPVGPDRARLVAALLGVLLGTG